MVRNSKAAPAREEKGEESEAEVQARGVTDGVACDVGRGDGSVVRRAGTGRI